MHTDRFTPLDAATLLRWMQHDLPNKQLFGIGRELFFMPKPDDPFRMERYGKVLETPLGVAAGPHTQLAQNILSAWLCGARYIELKTVQVLDELNVAKPCIDMADEGYNCEWSQELKLDQSFEEYLKAFVLLYVLRDMLNLPVEAAPGKGPGFIFNMSAGYNLEGIKSPAVQRFLDRMENAEEDVKRIKAELAQLYPAIEKMPIPARLSDNLTVSTMHGCPPDEVESIGRYFITERRYHTTIKLNPTLLGPERLRDILNTQLGYDVCVPDEAFGHDLKYNDGVAIIRNLAAAAETAGVAFGLKLTNTLETTNEKQNLPRSEGMVYMSGRSLHPISINLTERLQQEFDGKLDIAFSAGVDTFNVADTLACGLRPITMSSDILKPGGYGRLHQYLDTLRAEMRKAGAHTIAEWEKSRSPIADRRQSRFRQPRQLCGGCPRQAQPLPQGTVPLRFGQDRTPAPALRLRRRALHVGLSGGTRHPPVSRRRGPGRFRAGVAGHHRHQPVPEHSGHGLQPSVPEPVYPHQLRQAAHDPRGQALRGRKNGRSRFRRSRRPNGEARRRHRGGPGRAVLRPLPRRTGRGGAPVRRKAGARRHGGRRDPRVPPDRRQPAPRHRRHP